MSTDYTPAKDRMLVVIAKRITESQGIEWPSDLMHLAARAVLEEEKGKAGYRKGFSVDELASVLENRDAELAELKRRVAVVLEWLNKPHSVCENRLLVYQADFFYARNVLEGKVKP